MAGEASVGIIANPASGKDVRRLVGAASVVDNNEKVNVVRRLFAGLAATGVYRVHYMPEHFDIVGRALDGLRLDIEADPLDMRFEGRPRDTLAAAERLVGLGVGCLIALGGDGTARLVGSRSGDTPIVALSTGTNNALPSWIDGTVAGVAAGLVASGRVDLDGCAPRAKRLDVRVDDRDRTIDDIALVDLAISRERFVAARAIWEPDQLAELFLTRAEPGAIGLSAIGAHLAPTGRADPTGLWLRLGEGGVRVRAPIVPGMVRDVGIAEWRRLEPDQPVELRPGGGVVALDGEKEHELSPDAVVTVRLTRLGPRVVEIRHTIDQAARSGAFVVPAASDVPGASDVPHASGSQ
jgi:predicted polyphosphate/ATP-dependent NAD kinase